MSRSQLSRREWMILASGVAALGTAMELENHSPLLARTAQKRIRIGACDWTLGKRTNPESLVLAEKLGLDGVQVDMGSYKDGLPLRRHELQMQFLEAARKHGVAVSSLGILDLNEIPYKRDPRAQQWVADSIDICQAMGLKVVLLPFFAAGDLRNDPKGVDTVVERLKQVAPKAEKAGVCLGFESWLSARQHLDILERVGSPALKVYYDVGNSHKEGHDIYREIRLLGKNICEFHAKDYDALYGKGSIDFKQVYRAMQDIGYTGWIQIEGTQFPLGLEESIRYDQNYLRSVFSPST